MASTSEILFSADQPRFQIESSRELVIFLHFWDSLLVDRFKRVGSISTARYELELKTNTQNVSFDLNTDHSPLDIVSLYLKVCSQEQLPCNSFQTLHSDFKGELTGGTEKLVDRLSFDLTQDQRSLCFVGYYSRKRFHFIVTSGDQYFDFSSVSEEGSLNFLELHASNLVFLCHHFLNFNLSFLRALLELNFREKIFLVHDYYNLCPTVNLLSGPNLDKFCNVPSDLEICNRCQKDYWKSSVDLASYREGSTYILSKFDKIVAPSFFVKQTFLKAFPHLESRTEVISHDISYIISTYESRPPKENFVKGRILVVGHVGPHKGAKQLAALANELGSEFSIHVAGSLSAHSRRIVIHDYNGFSELESLAKKIEPEFVLHSTLCGETFSFVFFETLACVRAPQISLQYGNHAEVIRENNLGVTIDELSPLAFRSTVSQLRHKRSDVLTHHAAYMKSLAQDSIRSTKVSNYVNSKSQFPNLTESPTPFVRFRNDADKSFESLAEYFSARFKHRPKLIRFLKWLWNSYRDLRG